MWLFGYGSLIWKVDFPYKCKKIGYIKGYVRRFYQFSSDHRGTQEKPGRVVTLLPSENPEDQVWGVAYEIMDDENNSIWKQLDHREKNGYTRKNMKFYYSEGKGEPESSFDLVVYVGDPENAWYAGEASITEIANHIIPCRGLSGYNLEYLYQLANSMRQIAPHINDPHLFKLEEETLRIISESSQ